MKYSTPNCFLCDFVCRLFSTTKGEGHFRSRSWAINRRNVLIRSISNYKWNVRPSMKETLKIHIPIKKLFLCAKFEWHLRLSCFSFTNTERRLTSFLGGFARKNRKYYCKNTSERSFWVLRSGDYWVARDCKLLQVFYLHFVDCCILTPFPRISPDEHFYLQNQFYFLGDIVLKMQWNCV